MDQGKEFGDKQFCGLVQLAGGLLAVAAKDDVGLSESFGWQEEDLLLFQFLDEVAKPACELELSLLQDPYSHRCSGVDVQFLFIHVLESNVTP